MNGIDAIGLISGELSQVGSSSAMVLIPNPQIVKESHIKVSVRRLLIDHCNKAKSEPEIGALGKYSAKFATSKASKLLIYPYITLAESVSCAIISSVIVKKNFY